ncbi:MAG: hypothetical protein U0802_15510 [Candidatus Binatia bacterium]
MRWSSIVKSICALSAALAVASCGSSGFDSSGGQDSLTMQFTGFSGEGIDQQDLVGNTSADVDVCQSLCNVGGDLVDIEFETFTQTRANAIFMNMGASNILLDTYTVSMPGSGVPARTASVAAILPGGTCSNSPTRQCGLDSDCGGLGTCEHVETSVEILLYDFITKELVRGDRRCPSINFETGLIDPGDVIPQTYQTNVTFSGSDASGKRFNVKAGLVAGFFDANNCQSSGGGGN